MSGLSPIAGGTQSASTADPVALEIQALKADAEALRGLLSAGDIVAAKVLPFNGLTDLLAILGKRVAASLPPTVRPGDTLVLEVTGFDGDRIIVRNLGVADDAPEAQQQGAPSQPAGVDAESLTRTSEPLSVPPQLSMRPAPGVTLPAPPPNAAAAASAASRAEVAALPRAIFLDAALQSSIVQTEAQQASPSTPAGYPRVTIAVAQRAIETEQSLEAKLIAARTAAPTGSPPPAPPPAAQSRVAAPPVAAPPAAAQIATPRTPGWIEMPARAAAQGGSPAAESAPVVAPQASATARTAQTYSEPTLLLRSLRIPVTPTNVAAAKLALAQPERLPVALEALERALPLGSADPRVNTLRTIVGFLTNLDPESEAFPAQLSAYVSHVLDGPEPKLATVLQTYANAQAAADEQPATQPGAPRAAFLPGESESAPASGTAAATAASSNASAAQDDSLGSQVDVTVGNDTVAAGRIAERTIAMDHDLKTVLQSFISDPPPNMPPAALAAAQTALATLTAAQLANATQQDPRALTITLPLPFMGNGEPAHIKISREKPQNKERLDADNFHIAFVLQTKNVGTVAVDLKTVGRGVNVAVKSETPRHAAAFKARLEELGSRLEYMRYNVVGLDTEVVSRAGATITTAAPPPAPSHDGDDGVSGLDLRA